MSAPLTVAAWVVIIWALVVAKPLLLPFLFAILLSFMLAALLRWLERRKIPDWAGIVLVCSLIALPFAMGTGLAIHEARILVRDFPRIAELGRELPERVAAQGWAQSIGLDDFLLSDDLKDKLTEMGSLSAGAALHLARSVLEAGVHLVITLLFVVLMLASRKRLMNHARRILAHHFNEPPGPSTLDAVIELIEHYLGARFGIALGVALVDIVILKACGSPYGILMGFLLGASSFVPVAGFVVGIIPPIAMGLATGMPVGTVALMVGLLYLVSFIEGHFLAPKLLGDSLNLNLLATFAAIFAGELGWGIWGIVLAVPLLGVLRILMAASPRLKPWAALLSQRDV